MNTISNILSFPVAPKLWGISRNLFILFSFLFLLACSNDDDSGCVGVDCLPEATTTGEGTFGCLVNGEPFVDNSGNFNCFYQLVDGEYYFGIRGRQDSQIDQIFIGSEEKNIDNEVEILLKSRTNGNFFANVSFDCTNCQGATTTDTNPGSIIFNRLDFNNNIISASFEFIITNPNTGTVYEITEGRFDAVFTQ